MIGMREILMCLLRFVLRKCVLEIDLTHILTRKGELFDRIFFKQTGLAYKYKQLKNKWDLLKKEWTLWVKLVGREISLG